MGLEKGYLSSYFAVFNSSFCSILSHFSVHCSSLSVLFLPLFIPCLHCSSFSILSVPLYLLFPHCSFRSVLSRTTVPSVYSVPLSFHCSSFIFSFPTAPTSLSSLSPPPPSPLLFPGYPLSLSLSLSLYLYIYIYIYRYIYIFPGYSSLSPLLLFLLRSSPDAPLAWSLRTLLLSIFVWLTGQRWWPHMKSEDGKKLATYDLTLCQPTWQSTPSHGWIYSLHMRF